MIAPQQFSSFRKGKVKLQVELFVGEALRNAAKIFRGSTANNGIKIWI